MSTESEPSTIPVIDPSKAPGERKAWGRSATIVYLWGAAERLFVSNPWQLNSGLRRRLITELRRLLRDPSTRVAPGAAARREVETRFAIDRVAASALSAYRDPVASPKTYA